MLLDTIASAVPLISESLTLQPKWFQLFHPIGGVSARREEGGEEIDAASTSGSRTRLRRESMRIDFLYGRTKES
jgi:hypothetical protein